MRVAINLLFDGLQTTGAGLYGYRLATTLAARYPQHRFYVCLHRANAAKLWVNGQSPPANLFCVYGYFSIHRRWQRRLWEHCVLPWQLAIRRIDLLHSVDNTGVLGAPCRQVVTILDLAFLRYPRLRFERSKALWYRLMVPLSLHRAAAIIALSRATAEDIQRMLRPHSTKIIAANELSPDVQLSAMNQGSYVVVSPSGIDSSPLPEDEAVARRQKILEAAGCDPQQPYILMVGTVEPIKNHALAVRALALLRATITPDLTLVIIGRPERASAEVARLCAALSMDQGVVVHLGYLDDPADVRAFYQEARVVLCPSLHEGFGLPPLEAMAVGCPAICADRAALPEATQHAALLIDPIDPLDLAQAVYRLLADNTLRGQYVIKGQQVAARYTWDGCADQAMAIYNVALAPPL